MNKMFSTIAKLAWIHRAWVHSEKLYNRVVKQIVKIYTRESFVT